MRLNEQQIRKLEKLLAPEQSTPIELKVPMVSALALLGDYITLHDELKDTPGIAKPLLQRRITVVEQNLTDMLGVVARNNPSEEEFFKGCIDSISPQRSIG